MKIKIKFDKKIKILFVAILLCIPSISFAMNIEIGKQIQKIPQEDIVILDVYLNSEDKEINAIEGSITIEGEYEIKALSTAGSIFEMWPNKPSFLDDTISFTGGSSAGFFGSKLKIFSIAIKPTSDTDIVFSSQDIHVFLNNGIGTKLDIEKLNKTIEISAPANKEKNDLDKIIMQDKKSPEQFEIVIGQDESIFDGKYFASFNAIDNQSGINRYEVIEEGYSSILSGTPYVLQNQNLKGTLTVRAIDNAGNIRESKINIQDGVSEEDSINWKSLGIALLILLCIFFIYKKMKIKDVFK